MEYGPAKTLDDESLAMLLKAVLLKARRPEVDRAAFLLSYKAALRVQEIAGLEWDQHILDARGEFMQREFEVAGSKGRLKKAVYPVLRVSPGVQKGKSRPNGIGKYGTDRVIRIHPELLKALSALRALNLPGPFVIPSAYSTNQNLPQRAHALKMRIQRIYDDLGFVGCSSHSGRRTFITKTARHLAQAGCSLVDVQVMVGHRQLATTQQYIDSSANRATLVEFA